MNPLLQVLEVSRSLSSRTLMKNALGEVLALLQLAQFLTEQGALVLNCPKPAPGLGVRALGAGEAPATAQPGRPHDTDETTNPFGH